MSASAHPSGQAAVLDMAAALSISSFPGVAPSSCAATSVVTIAMNITRTSQRCLVLHAHTCVQIPDNHGNHNPAYHDHAPDPWRGT